MIGNNFTKKERETKMETKINNTRYITKFFHTQLPDSVFDPEKAKERSDETGVETNVRSFMKPLNVIRKILRHSKFKRTTTAKIYTFENGVLSAEPVAEGSVTCHPNDSYIKSFGRFYAFRSALENSTDETIVKNRSRMMLSYANQCHIPMDLFVQIALESLRTK